MGASETGNKCDGARPVHDKETQGEVQRRVLGIRVWLHAVYVCYLNERCPFESSVEIS